MHDLHWTDASFFSNPNVEHVLMHAIARYHGYVPSLHIQHWLMFDILSFLDLLSSSPASFFVPTLDIDLIWHTHQLMAEKYKSDCMEYVGRFIDQYVVFKQHLVVVLLTILIITQRRQSWRERAFQLVRADVPSMGGRYILLLCMHFN
jgi:hypothetical protein